MRKWTRRQTPLINHISHITILIFVWIYYLTCMLSIQIILWYILSLYIYNPLACQALSAALASGVRRRSLVHMTPLVAGPGKRPLRKSPETVASTASPATTTSPDPKRLMTESSSSEKASGCGPPPVRDDVVPTQLFGADGPSPGECLQGCHIYI